MPVALTDVWGDDSAHETSRHISHVSHPPPPHHSDHHQEEHHSEDHIRTIRILSDRLEQAKTYIKTMNATQMTTTSGSFKPHITITKDTVIAGMVFIIGVLVVRIATTKKTA